MDTITKRTLIGIFCAFLLIAALRVMQVYSIESHKSGAELTHEQEVKIIEPNEYSFECKIHGKVEALRYHDGFEMYKYCKRCYGEFLNRHLPTSSAAVSEPNEPEIEVISIEIVEPNIEHAVEFTICDEQRSVYFDKGKENEIVCDSTRDEYLSVMYELITSKEPTGKVSMRFTEPDEPVLFTPEWVQITPDYSYALPEYIISGPDEPEWNLHPIGDPNWHQLQATIHKDAPPGIYAIWASPGSELKPFDITDLIPTWPDYIELEKDLICFIPDDNDVCTVGDGIEHLLFPKGTKIYFK